MISLTDDELVVFMRKVEMQIKSVGGMKDLKSEVVKFAQEGFWTRFRSQAGHKVPSKRPVILFWSNPGTGKTFMASIVAGNWWNHMYEDIALYLMA